MKVNRQSYGNSDSDSIHEWPVWMRKKVIMRACTHTHTKYLHCNKMLMVQCICVQSYVPLSIHHYTGWRMPSSGMWCHVDLMWRWRQYIPPNHRFTQDLHSHRCENLKSYIIQNVHLRQKYASCDSMAVVYFMNVEGISAGISTALSANKLKLKTSLQ
jgi:hypothetical protein